MKPRRIQRKRTKGWRMPEDAVYVGRPGRYGNPWRVVSVRGDIGVARLNPDGSVLSWVIYGTSRASANYWAAKAFNWEALRLTTQGLLEPLRGRDLACWCQLCPAHMDGKPLGTGCDDCAPCHADVLLELANR